ncbi:MAG: hypothetical protein B6D41_17465 [Chloroflexi bacterium UTCFX4]|jgi:hypothetical protein|nr:MAG: hypothetical protein B6D41_17465 [Chloroflexi bacterium UTCFX4]
MMRHADVIPQRWLQTPCVILPILGGRIERMTRKRFSAFVFPHERVQAARLLDSNFRPLIVSWLLALGAGIGVGLFLAWYIFPVSYSNAQPYDLTAPDKDDYIKMIAASYALDNNYALAAQRLYYLQLPDAAARLTALARMETNPLTQQALVKLRLGMDAPSAALKRATSTPRPTRNLTPLPRITVIVLEPTAVLPTAVPPTALPTPIPPTSEPNPNAPRFELIDRRALNCVSVGGDASIQVEVRDANGRGLPGILVEINSARGNEQFYTGLKPERGAGFGDVAVLPGTYAVHLIENANSDIFGDLRIDANVVECDSDLTAIQGWRLVFQQTP